MKYYFVLLVPPDMYPVDIFWIIWFQIAANKGVNRNISVDYGSG